MYLPRLAPSGSALLACLMVFGGMVSTSQAQTPAGSPAYTGPQTRAISNRYQPQLMRPQGMITSRVVSQQQVEQPQTNQPESVVTPSPTPAGDSMGPAIGGDFVLPEGAYFEDGYVEGDFIDGDCGCGDGCCGGQIGCGGRCGGSCCGPLYDPRDCAPGRDCWVNGLGGILCNSEYFTGVQGFKHEYFADTGTAIFDQPDNCSFGYHFGFNSGLPLYNLTCGLVSGQIGLNYTRGNRNSTLATGQERSQTFVTAGFFRRVDYGLQFGAVADVLAFDFDNEIEVQQVRSEISWVWAGGSNAGFRATRGTQDSTVIIGGQLVPQLRISPINTYKLFYRTACWNGGYMECYIGRSDEDHTVFGGEYDLPVGEKTALYGSFNYLSPDEKIAFADAEAWNIQMGISFRPRGRDWYKFYHRPLFKVANNGSMVQSRTPITP